MSRPSTKVPRSASWCILVHPGGTWQCRSGSTDINAIPVLKQLTHLPVVVDPSHATGDAAFVPAVARAGIAAGADGLIVEVHPDPARALSDGKQSLRPEDFAALMDQLRRLAPVMDRTLPARERALVAV